MSDENYIDGWTEDGEILDSIKKKERGFSMNQSHRIKFMTKLLKLDFESLDKDVFTVLQHAVYAFQDEDYDIKIASEILTTEKEIRKNGGKVSEYRPFENIIKQVINKYLESPKKLRFTQNEALTEIAVKIYTQNTEIKEPALSTLKRWIARYEESNGASIFSK